MAFFEDRKILHESDAPNGRWRLVVYAPGRSDEDATYFAEFEKEGGVKAVGVPFGPPHPRGKVTVDWNLPKNRCGIYIDKQCYSVFKWGDGFIRPREFFRSGDEPPFSAEEISSV